jgi:hypothetical protein
MFKIWTSISLANTALLVLYWHSYCINNCIVVKNEILIVDLTIMKEVARSRLWAGINLDINLRG